MADDPGATKPSRWEYRAVDLVTAHAAEGWTRTLQALGIEGWEVVYLPLVSTQAGTPAAYRAILRRPIVEDRSD